VVFEVNRGTIDSTYETIKRMCDLIISICTNYTVDFTKHIIKLSEQYPNSIEAIFLSSLLMIHYFKLNEDVVDIMTHTSGAFYEQKSYYKRYHLLLRNYGMEINSIDIENLLSDPEKLD
jgi:hypothetical protein